MKTPIFLNEHGDISAFRNESAVKLFIEPIDVQNAEYAAFSADGSELTLSVSKGQVHLVSGMIKEIESDKLLDLINGFFRRTKSSPCEFRTLDAAVEAFIQTFGFSE